MDLTSILSDDGDVNAVRMALISSKAVLQEAARDYAEAALGAANETLKSVQSARPCGAVWPHMVEYQQLSQKARKAMETATQATGLLLKAEETGSDYIDAQNRDAKVSSMELHIVAALLEGAHKRMEIALNGIPQNGAPGELCTPLDLGGESTEGE